MPSEREREYYRMGFADGMKAGVGMEGIDYSKPTSIRAGIKKTRTRKLSAWNKFVKANSKKKIYQYASGKLKLKKMGIAFRKKRK
jgi:hypothetical protein